MALALEQVLGLEEVLEVPHLHHRQYHTLATRTALLPTGCCFGPEIPQDALAKNVTVTPMDHGSASTRQQPKQPRSAR